MVIIRGAASTNRISHWVMSPKLAPQPCVLSLTKAYYPVKPDYGAYPWCNQYQQDLSWGNIDEVGTTALCSVADLGILSCEA